ncbi:MAG: acyltransferase family protein [Dorea sp.]
MGEKKRIDWVDVAKGIGMICVILVHVEEYFMPPGTLVSTKIPLYTFHMPLFFFMSGYLFSMKSSFGEFLKNKCKRILIPYACLGIILVLFDSWWQGRNPFGDPWFQADLFKGELMALLTQNRFWTLWFIACLFWLNILFYILVRFVKKEQIRAIIVVILAAAGVLYYKNGGAALPWNVDICLTALPFFYVGYVCRKTDFINQKILSKKSKYAVCVGMIALDAVCAVVNLKMSGEFLEFFSNLYGFAPLTYIGAFAGIVAVIILSDMCHGFAPLCYIGANTMLLYAWHQTMMLPLIQEAYNKMNLFKGDWLTTGEYYGRLILTTMVICVVLGVVNEILCRIKLGFIVGK